jgi:hypothetical protein
MRNEDIRKVRDKMDEIDLLKSLLIKQECNLSSDQANIYNKLINDYCVSKNNELLLLKLTLFESYKMPENSIFVERDNKTFIK